MCGSGLVRMHLAFMLAFAGLLAAAMPATANRINSGGEAGAYHRDFCPALARETSALSTPYTCTPSSGTRENMERVLANPKEFGYGQLDVFLLESGNLIAGRALDIIRQDDARECVFAVTRNKDIASYGDLAAMAPRLRFSLPPQTSGSAGTFQYLRFLDGNGLGRAGRITHARPLMKRSARLLAAKMGFRFSCSFLILTMSGSSLSANSVDTLSP